MKKLLLTVVGGMILATSSVNAQAVEEGNLIIDGYYGFPNLYTSTLKSTYENADRTDFQVGGIGPVGGRVEYMLADKFGLGVDFGYSGSFVQYNYDDVDANNNPVVYTDKVSTRKIGVMATFNYHFLEHDDIDAYAMIGTGWRNRSYSYESTDPDYQSETISGLIPVSFRIGVGMRYFFTDNIGLNLGLGFGQGGVINGGLSFKI